jgi:hypothetical protein
LELFTQQFKIIVTIESSLITLKKKKF